MSKGEGHFMRNLLFAFAWIVISSPCFRVHSSTTVPKDIEIILADSSYDRHASPAQDDGYPTQVNISMYIEGLSSFQAQTMDFHVDIYFQEEWYDWRLRHNNTKRVLIKDEELFAKMWHPDIYFANARESQFHTVTAPNFLVWIHSDGRVYYDCRISLTVMCMMDLARYPLDRQNCEMRILSYAYDEEQLKLQWIESDAITKNDEIKLADMTLKRIETGVCNGTFPAGTWSCVTAEFAVQREIMHHVLQSYIPTALIVTISWFSFWLDVDSVPGRVSLCITTLLTLATQASAARLALPQVSYIKAIDVWMGTCLAFVFGVMIEFTLVNYWSRRKPPSERNSGSKDKPNAKDILKKWSELASMDNYSRDDRYVLDPLRVQTLRHRNGGSAMTDGSGNIKTATTSLDIKCEKDVRCDTPEPEWKALLFTPTDSDQCGLGDLSSRGIERPTPDRNRFLIRTQNRKVAQKIDRFCRIGFPVSFLIFNIVYWFYYLYWTS